MGLADFYVKSEKLPELNTELILRVKKDTTVEQLKQIIREFTQPFKKDKFKH